MRSRLFTPRFHLWPRGFLLVALLTACGLLVSGCDLLSSSESTGSVSLAFETTSSTSATAAKRAAAADVTIEGSNGTLTISRLVLVVGEFELEGAEQESESEEEDGETESESEEESETDEFERGPFWTDVPLDGSTVEVTAGRVPEGLYEELSFEVEDLEDDEEGEEGAQIQAIRSELESKLSEWQTDVAEWPTKASMVAIGSFTPDGGSSRSFTTFFEAEIEIEKEFSPPMEVQGGTSAKQVTVQIDPGRWFEKSDGTVRDLSAHDYGETGRLLEFEVEIEEGFTETEIEQEFEEDDED